jgi:hypothetical protein
MWDLLVTIGNIIVIPALLNMVLDKKLYVPRISSGVSLIGLALVIAGLIGGGFVLSPIVVGVIAAFWLFIFLFRGQPVGHEAAMVVPEVGAEIYVSPEEPAPERR